jgi:hypothetical protein
MFQVKVNIIFPPEYFLNVILLFIYRNGFLKL